MFKKTFALILTVIMTFAMSVYPAYSLSFNAGFNPESGVITLSGTGEGNIIVRMGLVESDGKEPLDAFSDANPPIIMDRFFANGEFTYSCILPDGTQAGKYKIYLNDALTLVDDSFRFYDVVAAETNIIPIINSAISNNNYSQFHGVITSSAEALGIDSSDSIYISKNSFITELLFNCFDSFDSAADFYSRYYEMYSVAAISGASQNEIEELLSKYEGYLNIDFNTDYKNDTRLTTTIKSKLCELLSKHNYKSDLPKGIGFKQILNSLKPVAAVKQADKWQDINQAMKIDYIKDFEFIFNENAEHKSLSSLTSVYSLMMSDIGTCNSLTDVQKSFNKAVKSVLNNNTGSSGSLTPSGNMGGTSVSMPADDSKIDTLNPSAPAKMFTDVDSDFWGFEAINELAKSKIINGYEDGTFKSDEFITRAEFTKIIVVLSGLELRDSEFSDVGKEAWYSKYVGAAASAGIVNGYDGVFNPESPITRQDAATIIYRVLEEMSTEFSDAKTFADSEHISEYAKKAISGLSSIGIINGYTSGEFRPFGDITRAEAVQMIYKTKLLLG